MIHNYLVRINVNTTELDPCILKNYLAFWIYSEKIKNFVLEPTASESLVTIFSEKILEFFVNRLKYFSERYLFKKIIHIQFCKIYSYKNDN
jgi:hypothetical protein